ncbi:MAG: ArsR/SmtB family transcription factor [Oscillospiraceae bacterium]
MKIRVCAENAALFACLASETRLKIIELLAEHEAMNVSAMADRLGVSAAITTRHVAMMEECGLLLTETLPAKRGMQKLCRLNVRQITLCLAPADRAKPVLPPHPPHE